MSKKTNMEIRLPYVKYKHPGKTPEGERITEQHHAELLDVNKMIARYQQTGTIPQRDVNAAEYLYCPSEDFSEAMHMVKNAEREFSLLPAKVRARFENSVEKLVNALDDPAQENTLRAEFEEMGVIPKRETPEPPLEKEDKKPENKLD